MIRWLTFAEAQRDSLPALARQELFEVLDLLSSDPRDHGVYDDTHDQWSATFGHLGVVLYTIDEPWMMLTVLRVIWVGD